MFVVTYRLSNEGMIFIHNTIAYRMEDACTIRDYLKLGNCLDVKIWPLTPPSN